MKNDIVTRFSHEVEIQINQFGIDLIEDISNEIDREIENFKPALGLSIQQLNAFQTVLQTARQKVLAKYDLETRNSRTDAPYVGEKYDTKK